MDPLGGAVAPARQSSQLPAAAALDAAPELQPFQSEAAAAVLAVHVAQLEVEGVDHQSPLLVLDPAPAEGWLPLAIGRGVSLAFELLINGRDVHAKLVLQHVCNPRDNGLS